MSETSTNENKPSRIHNTFLTISVIVNVILAIIAGYSAYKKSKLEDQKTKIEISKSQLENELFLEKNTPRLSTFYLISRIETFYDFLNSKGPFPFTQQVEKFRILDNQYTDQLSQDFDKMNKARKAQGSIQFLVIANTEDVNAYDVKLSKLNNDTVETGGIESHTALLIPISYDRSISMNTKPTQVYSSISYSSRVGNLHRSFIDKVHEPVSISWLPTLGNNLVSINSTTRDKLKVWGRAKPKEDNDYLKILLQK